MQTRRVLIAVLALVMVASASALPTNLLTAISNRINPQPTHQGPYDTRTALRPIELDRFCRELGKLVGKKYTNLGAAWSQATVAASLVHKLPFQGEMNPYNNYLHGDMWGTDYYHPPVCHLFEIQKGDFMVKSHTGISLYMEATWCGDFAYVIDRSPMHDLVPLQRKTWAQLIGQVTRNPRITNGWSCHHTELLRPLPPPPRQ